MEETSIVSRLDCTNDPVTRTEPAFLSVSVQSSETSTTLSTLLAPKSQLRLLFSYWTLSPETAHSTPYCASPVTSLAGLAARAWRIGPCTNHAVASGAAVKSTVTVS